MIRFLRNIPNTLTLCNLLCGCVAIICALHLGDFEVSLLFMLGAGLFDFLDGLCARLLKSNSVIGVDLDSLADVVSFGVAPALITTAYMQMVSTSAFWRYLPLFIALLAALRLAKFNHDARQSSSFIGMPAPACALLIASYIAIASSCVVVPPRSSCYISIPCFISIFCTVVALLMVSDVPMFSLKFKNLKLKDNLYRYLLLALALAEAVIILALGARFTFCVFAIICTYLILNFLKCIFKRVGESS